MNKYKEHPESGFTLVELSIVVVIIALLIAGASGGVILVKQAKFRNVIKEINEYDIGVKGFREKFKYYPGDLPNATAYWSGATNGNGNWQINFTAGATEDLQFWHQLALSGFIPGSYTGAVAGTRYTIGINIPKSAFTGGGYDVYYWSPIYAVEGNFIEMSALRADGMLGTKIMNGADAYLIDTKIDDGLASSGNLYAIHDNTLLATTSCVSDRFDSASSATYTLSDPTIACRLIWWLDKSR